MTNSQTGGLRGEQQPRISFLPEAPWSLGDDAIDLAAMAGLHLDPWQEIVLRGAMGEREADKWSAFEVGLIVSRQNGKGSILEARELHALYLEPKAKLILHSAHEFKTASEAFLRIKMLVDNTDALRKKVARMRTSHGEEGIELIDGSRLRFVARSTGSGRGFSGDLVILDEAYNLSAAAMAALMPTLSARPNPQLWYTSSAGMPSSDQLRRVRDRGRSDKPGRLAYFEWSAHEDAALDDRQAWAQANPALGIRISDEFVEVERASLPDEEFSRERLGVWPDDGGVAVIDLKKWEACTDPESVAEGQLVIAIDVAPDRRDGSIAVCGRRADDRLHVKILDFRDASYLDWLIGRVVELDSEHRPAAVLVDPAGPAGSIIADLEDKGVEVTSVTARELAQACGAFHDDAVTDRLRHLGQGPLNMAVRSATTRNLGDAWAWDRRFSGGSISPLVAATLAAYGFRKYGAGVPSPWIAYA